MCECVYVHVGGGLYTSVRADQGLPCGGAAAGVTCPPAGTDPLSPGAAVAHGLPVPARAFHDKGTREM